MALELIDTLNGIFSLCTIIFSLFVGIRISTKYFKFKRIEFLLFGLCTILLTEPWWPHSVSFIYALTTGKEGGLQPELYFIIGNVLIPLALLLWLWLFSELIAKEKQKKILIFGVIYLTIFEIIFFSMLFLDPTLIGELQGPVHVKYNYGLIYLLLSGVIIASITGLKFIHESLRSDNPEIKFRGKLIMIAITILFAGAILEALLSSIIFFLILSRILLIFCGFFFYISLIPPKRIKNRFQKENAKI